jgi:hypothetical protein
LGTVLGSKAKKLRICIPTIVAVVDLQVEVEKIKE